MKNLIIMVSAAALLSACASHSTAPESTSASSATKSTADGVDLVLSGKLNDESWTSYHSMSAIENFEDGQKIRDHQEGMDFLESTTITEMKGDLLTVMTKTLEKDGTSSLHDFAFPEPTEVINFIYNKKAKVISAEPFPRESIFFLPPVSLPIGRVKVGDTWTMNHSWISSNQGLPLNLDMVTIFKDLVSCGEYGKCADLEVSGRIDVMNDKFQRSVSFDSRLWGRMLFSLDRGDVIWSEVRSHEVFKAANTETRVTACMVSKMSKVKKLERLSCETSLKAVTPPSL